MQPPVISQQDPAGAPDDDMNKEQLAKRLEVTERTVERYMSDGLPYYKYGRRVRFKWSEVEKHFISTCHVVKAPVAPLKKRAIPPPAKSSAPAPPLKPGQEPPPNPPKK